MQINWPGKTQDILQGHKMLLLNLTGRFKIKQREQRKDCWKILRSDLQS